LVQNKLCVSIRTDPALAGIKIWPHAATISNILHSKSSNLLSCPENRDFLITDVGISRANIQPGLERQMRDLARLALRHPQDQENGNQAAQP
jgi:hypothetical protein